MKTFIRTPPVRQNPQFTPPPAAAPSAYSYLTVERRGLVSVVSFNGRAILEENAIRAIGDEIVRIAEKFGSKQLILNFSDVRNLSSYMLATLVSVHKKLAALGGRMVLCGIDAELMRIIELTSLHKLFKICPTVGDSMRYF
jgi:anti-sigma B factor antagonist